MIWILRDFSFALTCRKFLQKTGYFTVPSQSSDHIPSLQIKHISCFGSMSWILIRKNTRGFTHANSCDLSSFLFHLLHFKKASRKEVNVCTIHDLQKCCRPTELHNNFVFFVLHVLFPPNKTTASRANV